MTTRRVAAFCVAILMLVGTGFAKDKKPQKADEPPQKFATLEFLIVRDTTGKPVMNASVILRAVDEKGKQAKGGPQLKTNSEGKASMNDVPYGTVRIQIIAPGFQTYGEDYQVNQDKMQFTIRLKPPKPQVSIY